MFNGFGIQEAFWMGVIIATMAVVSTGIVVIVAWLYGVIDTMIGKIQAWYKRYKWNKLPIEERRRILRQRLMYLPHGFPITTMLTQFNNTTGKPEFKWKERAKPPQTSQETPQTPDRPHDEPPPE